MVHKHFISLSLFTQAALEQATSANIPSRNKGTWCLNWLSCRATEFLPAEQSVSRSAVSDAHKLISIWEDEGVSGAAVLKEPMTYRLYAVVI